MARTTNIATAPHPFGHLLHVLACILNTLCAANQDHLLNHTSLFYNSEIPAMSIADYVKRISKNWCDEHVFVTALVYLDRLSRTAVSVDMWTVHRLFLTAVLVANKYTDDEVYEGVNSFYSKLGGVSLSELNSLEVEFLFLLKFDLKVSAEEYSKYRSEIDMHSGHCECCSTKTITGRPRSDAFYIQAFAVPSKMCTRTPTVINHRGSLIAMPVSITVL